jgi:hypothetical protein
VDVIVEVLPVVAPGEMLRLLALRLKGRVDPETTVNGAVMVAGP